MKNQLKFFLSILSIFVVAGSLSAQPMQVDYTDADGFYVGTYTETTVPSSAVGKYLVVAAVGGDGGNVNYDGSHRSGGKGAYVRAAFPITNSIREGIQPGDIIRFIVGSRGASNSGTKKNQYTAGGGGGTGICHFNQRTNTWNILVVAGGGSGASRGFSDNTGKPGKKYTANMSYPTINRDKYTLNYGAGATEGYSVQGERSTWTAYAGMQDGIPTGGSASGDEYDGYLKSGGWGFGPGGRGNNLTTISDDKLEEGLDGPGGGGGYKISDLATGGYSYINETMAHSDFLSFERGASYDVKNGYAIYQYSNSTELPTSQMESIGKTGYCISTLNSDILQLVSCRDASSAKINWLQDLESFRLLAKVGRCLDIPSMRVGTAGQLRDCNGEAGQQWVFDGVTQQIWNTKDKTKCLSWDKYDNLKIKLANCADVNDQKWNISAATSFDLGEYNVATIRSMLDANKCIDNTGGKIVNGNPIQLSQCAGTDGNDNQKWFFDGYGIRLSERRDKCLDVPSQNNSTPLQLYYCHATDHGASSHEWFYDGMTKMVRYRDNISKCLSLSSDDTANGNSIVVEDCILGLDRMKWTLKSATPHLDDALFGNIKQASNGRCMDLKDSNASDGANIQSLSCNGTQAQGWFVQDRHIKLAKDLGFCLASTGYDGLDGENVHLWECKDLNNEKWIFDVTYGVIRSQASPTNCLFNNSGSIKIKTCDYDDPARMQWKLPVDYSATLAGDKLKIHLAKADGKCVTVKENEENGTLRVWSCENDASQYFYFDGPRIRSVDNHNLCVDINSTDAGSDIRMWPCNDIGIHTRGQAWFYDAVSGRIHSNADPTKCMSFTNGSTTDGTNVELLDCNDYRKEIFVIK